MSDQNQKTLFGLNFVWGSQERDDIPKQGIVPVEQADEDGEDYVIANSPLGGISNLVIEFDSPRSKSVVDQISRYRGVAEHPDVAKAIDHIVNEAVSGLENGLTVKLNMNEVKLPQHKKNRIEEEFKKICHFLDFTKKGHDIFKRWYIDGRLYYWMGVDQKNLTEGIKSMTFIPPTQIRKVKEQKRVRDSKTGVMIYKQVKTWYVLNQSGAGKEKNALATAFTGGQYAFPFKVGKDSVCSVMSGVVGPSLKVQGYLHYALRAITQLRYLEDALIIYRLARAPERRVFYIDVGNKGATMAEEVVRTQMERYRNKLSYDPQTGQIRDSRRHLAITEDFWFPRIAGGRGTEVSTLAGGENLGQIEDVKYFQKNLYKALNVPISRLDTDNSVPFFSGKPESITRDEVAFQRFINRLRKKFADVFLKPLRVQLLLKGIITPEEWEENKTDFIIDYIQDTYFSELKELEIARDRFQLLSELSNFVPLDNLISRSYAYRLLGLTEKEVEEIKKEIEAEIKEGDYPDPKAQNLQPQEQEGQDGQEGGEPAQAPPQQESKNNITKLLGL